MSFEFHVGRLENYKDIPAHKGIGVKVAIIGDFISNKDYAANQVISDELLQRYALSLRVRPSEIYYNTLVTKTTKQADRKALVKFKNDSEFQARLASIESDLKELQPNLVILLGDLPTSLALPGKGNTADAWCGSVFGSSKLDNASFLGHKLIVSHTYATVFKQPEKLAEFNSAFSRAAKELLTPEIPEDNRVVLVLSAHESLSWLQDQLAAQPSTIAWDIEGGVWGLRCLSFAENSDLAVVMPWEQFTVEQQAELLPLLNQFLNSEHQFVLQNCLYDTLVLHKTLGLVVKSIYFDTMLAAWELEPELDKDLGTLVKRYTRRNYHKSGLKSISNEAFYRYSGLDSAATFEVYQQQIISMSVSARKHFEFMMDLVNPARYMELKGIKFDSAKAEQLAQEINAELQPLLDAVNDSFNPTWRTDVAKLDLERAEKRITKKLYDERMKTYVLNTNSPKQLQDALYVKWGFPVQYEMIGRQRTDKIKTDVNALLELYTDYPEAQNKVLYNLLRISQLSTALQTLSPTLSKSGRIHCSYTIPGTVTGRFACKQSNLYNGPDPIGFNLQTVTAKQKVCYVADPDSYLFNCDLAGADGWTVAAWALYYGDPTMMDDLKAGLKPAKVIALMFERGVEMNSLSREELHEACKTFDESGWLYFACKQVQHGTSYLLGPDKTARLILLQSWKRKGTPIHVSTNQCLALQTLFHMRYPGVARYQQHCQKQLRLRHGIESSAGHFRHFHGNPNDQSTLRDAVAQEPQNNTTYATSMALRRLWLDPENRDANGHLIIKCQHQVHDSLMGCFPKSRAEWASAKIKSYFQNPMTIAGTELIIPYDGGYGENWKNLTFPL